LVECNISRNSDITQDVRLSNYCVIAYVTIGQKFRDPCYKLWSYARKILVCEEETYRSARQFMRNRNLFLSIQNAALSKMDTSFWTALYL